MTSVDERNRSALRHTHRRARSPEANAPLTRSRHGVAGGVAAGIGEFVGTDAATMRWIWALSLPLSGGLSALAYLALWLLLPKAPADRKVTD